MKFSKLILFFIILLGISASNAAWAASPAIFYSDLTAGPNTGGQNNNGVFVTIWGNNFGSTQGSSYITVGGGKVNNYPTWTNTMICFQLGSSAATGNIVLNSSNGNATGPAFTVQAGNIYFVQPGASTNGTGTYTSPFNHLQYFESIAAPGDTVYVMSGTIYDEIDGHAGWHGIVVPETSGTQGSPVSWIAYPNATVILQADGGTQLWPTGASDTVQYIFRGYASWQTVSKFTMELTGTNGLSAIDSTGNDGWKVVGNNITASTYIYAIVGLAGNYSSVLGNEIHNSGASQGFNNEDHSIYWDGGGTNVEIGWNYLHDNQNTGWEISLFHQGSTAEPTRIGKIHDNLITNANGYLLKGILLGDVDAGENETDVEAQNIQVYNNVLYNLGENENGGAIQAVSGTAYIYNNTIYQSPDSTGTIQFPTGGIGPGGGHPVWYVANNIIYNSLSNALYLSDGNGNAPTWSNFALLSNNNYYGSGNGPSQDPRPVNANPQFIAAGSNFQLQASSPDINAGYNTVSIVLEDIAGLLRSTTPSIGAYQYSSSSSTPTPVVSITSPTTGSSVPSGSNISITATASETNGSISNIAIYSGSTLLGSSSSSPYTYVMSNPAAGNYTLTAVATDAKGVSVTSSAVTVTVTAQSVTPSSPVVTITSPASGSSYTAGSNVTITTTASEKNGTISNIYLYNGSGVLLGTSSSSPFNFVDSNMAAGGYSFYAVAKDANGVSTTSSTINITVTAPSSTPTISLTSPSNNAAFSAPASIFLSANASETNGTITQVQFFNGSTPIYTATSAPYSYTWTSNLLLGTYTITAQATDSRGVVVTSAPATISIALPSSLKTGSLTPTVAITSPNSGSSIAAGSSLNITANASETNGNIAVVYFYNGSTFLGSDSTSPYNFTWNNVPAGSYTLTAKAVDANGVSVTSSPVTGTATGTPPVVTITSPANGTNFTVGSTLTITASASETNGSIAQVQYYSGSYLLATATTSPYTASWTNATAGTFTLTAKATDTNGVSTTSSPITINVLTTSTPVISITSPANGSTITAGSNLTITANASETNGSISEVYFYNGTTSLGSDSASPYSYTWNNIPAGTYSFIAVAIDANGVSVSSNPVAVTVTAPAAPVVAITSPSNGSNITAGSNFSITASASETNGSIAQVQFYYGSTLLGTDTSSPYSYSWTNIAAGNYTLTAKATDANGVSTTSSAVSITVAAAPSAPPAVSITSPSDGSTITAGSNLSITASASETNGTIAQVQFYYGSTLLGTDTSSPYSYSWTNIAAGNYTLTAKATDSNGVSTTSSAVSITVKDASPMVSITSPSDGSTITAGSNLSITASASETNGSIAQVQFYYGSTLLGTDTSSPYTYSWTNIAAGNYTLTAKATDSNGVSTTSSAVSITVKAAPSAPVVAITSPSNGSTYSQGSTFTITASASETNGSIAQVQYYSGSNLLATATTSPYTASWTNATAGTYTLTAKATDTNGTSTTSSPITITVNPSSSSSSSTSSTSTTYPPVVSLTSPTSGSYALGSTVTISANASETNGSIAQVQFYLGSTLLYTATSAPYTYSWKVNQLLGTYSLTAQASDSRGVVVTSAPVTVTVAI